MTRAMRQLPDREARAPILNKILLFGVSYLGSAF
jgi:hypothetical protein